MLIETGIGAFLESSIGGLVKRGLSAIGVGYVSYEGVTTVADGALFYAQTQFAAIGNYALDMLGVAGFGVAFSMLATAFSFRLTMQMTRKFMSFGLLH